MRLVKSVMKKPLRQQNRQIISYVPRTEPAPPEHAIKMDSFRDVWMLRSKYVAFVLMGESFLRSPAFTVPESAQRWANQIRQEGEVTE
ncbi:cell division activator CedA [Escherichia coli]|nr:cell division activator CedA [Escherichia coli]